MRPPPIGFEPRFGRFVNRPYNGIGFAFAFDQLLYSAFMAL